MDTLTEIFAWLRQTNFGAPSAIDEVGAAEFYMGFTPVPGHTTADEVWQIIHVKKTGNVWEVKHAGGRGDIKNKWDDRATLTYLF